MSIYAIGDLHLSFGTNKPMDIFGFNWENHAEKIRENWIKKVKDDDLAATLVAESIALQLEKRISFRKAMKQAMQKTMRSGAQK